MAIFTTLGKHVWARPDLHLGGWNYRDYSLILLAHQPLGLFVSHRDSKSWQNLGAEKTIPIQHERLLQASKMDWQAKFSYLRHRHQLANVCTALTALSLGLCDHSFTTWLHIHTQKSYKNSLWQLNYGRVKIAPAYFIIIYYRIQ